MVHTVACARAAQVKASQFLLDWSRVAAKSRFRRLVARDENVSHLPRQPLLPALPRREAGLVGPGVCTPDQCACPCPCPCPLPLQGARLEESQEEAMLNEVRARVRGICICLDTSAGPEPSSWAHHINYRACATLVLAKSQLRAHHVPPDLSALTVAARPVARMWWLPRTQLRVELGKYREHLRSIFAYYGNLSPKMREWPQT